jgi:hypothetical protein
MTLCTPESAINLLAVTAAWFDVNTAAYDIPAALDAVARLVDQQDTRITLLDAENSRLRQRLAYETGQR